MIEDNTMDAAKLLEPITAAEGEVAALLSPPIGTGMRKVSVSSRAAWIFWQQRYGWTWECILQEPEAVVRSQTAFLMFEDCIRDAQLHGYNRWAV